MFAENRCGKRFVFWRPGKKFFRFPHISSLSRRKRRRGCKLVDEGCKRPDSKIGTKGAKVQIQKSGRREQLVPIQKFGRRVQTSRFKIGTKGAKKKIFFFSQSVDRKCQSDHSAESLTGLSKRPSWHSWSLSLRGVYHSVKCLILGDLVRCSLGRQPLLTTRDPAVLPLLPVTRVTLQVRPGAHLGASIA